MVKRKYLRFKQVKGPRIVTVLSTHPWVRDYRRGWWIEVTEW